MNILSNINITSLILITTIMTTIKPAPLALGKLGNKDIARQGNI